MQAGGISFSSGIFKNSAFLSSGLQGSRESAAKGNLAIGARFLGTAPRREPGFWGRGRAKHSASAVPGSWRLAGSRGAANRTRGQPDGPRGAEPGDLGPRRNGGAGLRRPGREGRGGLPTGPRPGSAAHPPAAGQRSPVRAGTAHFPGPDDVKPRSAHYKARGPSEPHGTRWPSAPAKALARRAEGSVLSPEG